MSELHYVSPELVVVTLSRECYAKLHSRICRPVGLDEHEINSLLGFATKRLGHRYDPKNIVDLTRYLIQTPPVPHRWKRRMLLLDSGDSTQAICSSLIAQSFQSVRYPILPEVSVAKSSYPAPQPFYA